ncbi:hypothetical protein HBB16_19700 [Pseudonocardia sp. MCCB 268]|nr:hypothetical protein [Pseudonocardia cytotoxica]
MSLDIKFIAARPGAVRDQCALQLRAAEEFDVADIERIEVDTNARTMLCNRRRPTTPSGEVQRRLRRPCGRWAVPRGPGRRRSSRTSSPATTGTGWRTKVEMRLDAEVRPDLRDRPAAPAAG